MNKKVRLACMAAALLGCTTISAGAMHIAEGYLPKSWCVIWYLTCVPFVVAGFVSIRRKLDQNPRLLTLLAMCGAFAFVLSALKIPSVSGSCSHPTGVGLGAILFGPAAMTVIGLIVLIFQALLLAHGGLTTLGANVLSMAIVGPLVSYGLYRLMRKTKLPAAVGIFIASAVGNLATYVVAAAEMALAHQALGFWESFVAFSGIFAITQIPLAICEGILTVVVFNVLEKYSLPQLRELHVL